MPFFLFCFSCFLFLFLSILNTVYFCVSLKPLISPNAYVLCLQFKTSDENNILVSLYLRQIKITISQVGLQGEDNFSGIEIEPLRFSEIGSLKFDFEPGEEGFSVPQVSTDLGNKTLVGEIDSSLRFESETTMLNMTADGQEIANLCMWCEREFKVGAEGPSSFMCPSCKDNISG